MGGRYRAFISYTPADRDIARRLQRRLESYRLDGPLRVTPDGPLPSRPLTPIFRDEDELVPGSDLPGRLKKALDGSDFLIVVCSPKSAKSLWVAEEVEHFRRLGREDRILALVIDGEPNAHPRGLSDDLECLPLPLRTTGGLEGGSDGDPEVLWVDWRGPARRDRRTFLRLVAALLSLESFDELVRRDRSQDRIRFWRSAALAITLLGLATNAVWALVSAKQAETRSAVKEATAAFNTGDFEEALHLVTQALPAGRGVVIDWSNKDAVQLANAVLYRNRLRAVIYGETLSNDGSFMADGVGDGVVFLRTASGAQLAKITLKDLQCCEGGHVAVRPDRKAAAILQWRLRKPYRILIADFDNPGRRRWIDWKEEDRPEGLWFSSDGLRLLALDKANKIRVFDLATLAEVGRSAPWSGTVLCVRARADGEIQVLTAAGIGRWRVGSKDMPMTPTEALGSLLQCPGGGRSNLAVTLDGQEVRVLDMDTAVIARRRRFEQTIVSADIRPSGLLVVVDDKAIASVFDQSDQLIWRALLVHERNSDIGKIVPPTRASFVGETLLATERGQDVKLWDLASSGLIGSLPAVDGPLKSMRISPDGRRIFTRSKQGVLRLRNADNGATLAEMSAEPDRSSGAAAFSRDGRFLAATYGGSSVVWATSNGAFEYRAFSGGTVKEVAISGRGEMLAARTTAGPIEIWKVGESKAPMTTFAPYEGEVINDMPPFYWYDTYLDFSDDAKRLLVAERTWGENRRPVKLFDVHSGRLIRDVWSGPYRAARYDPAGRSIVVSQDPGTLLLDERGGRIGRDKRDNETRRPWRSIRGQVAFGLNAPLANDIPSSNTTYLTSEDVGRTGRTVVLHEDGAIRTWKTPEILNARQLAKRICAKNARRPPPGACNRSGLLDFSEWSRFGMIVLLVIAMTATAVALFFFGNFLLALPFAVLLLPIWGPFVILRNRRRRPPSGKLHAATGATPFAPSS